jgi:hypothetical protein
MQWMRDAPLCYDDCVWNRNVLCALGLLLIGLLALFAPEQPSAKTVRPTP